MFNRGGQRRTIEVGCGWRCVGHPQEVNKKFILHKRYCKDCKIDKLPDFDREAGDINGWKDNTNRNQKPNQRLTTVFVNGVRKDVLMDGVKTTEQAMDNTRLAEELIAEENSGKISITKSQKKRQKQKAKKQAENDEKCELLGKAIYEKVSSKKLDAFLDKYEDNKEDGGLELAELAGEYMTLEELDALIKMLSK